MIQRVTGLMTSQGTIDDLSGATAAADDHRAADVVGVEDQPALGRPLRRKPGRHAQRAALAADQLLEQHQRRHGLAEHGQRRAHRHQQLVAACARARRRGRQRHDERRGPIERRGRGQPADRLDQESANTQYNGSYIFSGTATTTAPYPVARPTPTREFGHGHAHDRTQHLCRRSTPTSARCWATGPATADCSTPCGRSPPTSVAERRRTATRCEPPTSRTWTAELARSARCRRTPGRSPNRLSTRRPRACRRCSRRPPRNSRTPRMPNYGRRAIDLLNRAGHLHGRSEGRRHDRAEPRSSTSSSP